MRNITLLLILGLLLISCGGKVDLETDARDINASGSVEDQEIKIEEHELDEITEDEDAKDEEDFATITQTGAENNTNIGTHTGEQNLQNESEVLDEFEDDLEGIFKDLGV